MRMRSWIIVGLFAIVIAPGVSAAQTGDPVAVLTEIKTAQGEVRVKPAGEADWKAPLPLLSLRAGDQVRATANATVVLMFTGGQGTVTVSAANSPYAVTPPTAAGPGGKNQGLLSNLSRMLAGKRKDLAYVPLATRSVKQPPLLLFPRTGKLLAPPTFEWGGSDRLRYAVRVLGPQGLIWEQDNLPRAALPYPASASRLQPGVSYRWELEAKDFPVQQGRFVLLLPSEIAPVQEALRSLDPSALPGYPKNTVALMRAGYLFEQELFSEAREELAAALAADPDEPSLHLLLGHVYDRIGLKELAAEEFDEAQFLSSRAN